MKVNIHEAKTHLSLLRRVALGEEMTISKAGVPVARLVPVRGSEGKRTLRLFKERSGLPTTLTDPYRRKFW